MSGHYDDVGACADSCSNCKHGQPQGDSLVRCSIDHITVSGLGWCSLHTPVLHHTEAQPEPIQIGLLDV